MNKSKIIQCFTFSGQIEDIQHIHRLPGIINTAQLSRTNECNIRPPPAKMLARHAYVLFGMGMSRSERNLTPSAVGAASTLYRHWTGCHIHRNFSSKKDKPNYNWFSCIFWPCIMISKGTVTFECCVQMSCFYTLTFLPGTYVEMIDILYCSHQNEHLAVAVDRVGNKGPSWYYRV